VFLEHVGEGFVSQVLNRRHPVASKLGQLGERVLVKRDQFAHAASSSSGSQMASMTGEVDSSWNKPAALPLSPKGRFPMIRASAIVAIAVGAILISPALSLAQSAGSGGAATSSSGAATAPATNSAGTAQSSGANTAPGVTTGSAGSLGTGTAATPQTNTDAAIDAENKTIDRRLHGICRGC
jgi:hypothetical protein